VPAVAAKVVAEVPAAAAEVVAEIVAAAVLKVYSVDVKRQVQTVQHCRVLVVELVAFVEASIVTIHLTAFAVKPSKEIPWTLVLLKNAWGFSVGNNSIK
jgi:hypothetical protein